LGGHDHEPYVEKIGEAWMMKVIENATAAFSEPSAVSELVALPLL
jgi:hypothetical protein